jgi:hypothetical protein
MPILNHIDFVPSGVKEINWLYFTPEAYCSTLEKEHIPTSKPVIRRGAAVEATNGRVGRVDEFLFNWFDNTVTHIVLREGHLWGYNNVTIPLSQIDRIEENTVWLKLDKLSIETLLAFPVHHRWVKED